MMSKLSIFIAAIIAVLLVPAMAYAAAGTVTSSGGWAGLALLGVAAAGTVAKLRAEDDKPDEEKDTDAEGDEPPEEAGLEPSGVCASCGMGNDDKAKFCNQCGASMAAQPLNDGDEGATALVAAKRVTAEASVAAILGASSESVPAVKTRAIDLRQVFDTAAGVFGSAVPGEIIGALLGVPEQIAAGKRAIAAQAKSKVTAEKDERWGLARRLNALSLDGRPRSSIFEDKIDDETGERKALALRPEYARMDLDVFRGLVQGFERGRAAKPRDPFQPSRERAELAARAVNPRKPPAVDAAADVIVPWAKSQPAFASVRKQTPATITDEQIARQLAATMQPRGVQ